MLTEIRERDHLACSFYRNQQTLKGRIGLLSKYICISLYVVTSQYSNWCSTWP